MMSEKIWKFFCSLKLLGIILSALIVSILIGSFIIQKPIAQEGQLERAYSPETLRIFEFFGFLDLFHSPWFAFLIMLLGVNIICCSINMWPRHVKLAFINDNKKSDALIKAQPQNFEMKIVSPNIEKIAEALARFFKKPEIFRGDGFISLFVNKMKLAHFGVYIIHTGLVIIIMGGVWGSIDGFEGQMSLVEGQTSNHIYIKNAVRDKNRLLDFSIKCHDIRIDTYENGSAKDYYSDLEVLDKNGKSVFRKIIEVNEPLTYGGMSFYQANYGKQKKNEEKTYRFEYTAANLKNQKPQIIELSEYDDAVVIPGTKKTLQLLDHNDFVQMPTEDGPVSLGEAVRLMVREGEAPETVTLFKDYPQLDAHLRPQAKDHFVFNGIKEKFELVEVTGLQVARDPGAAVVFTGCAIFVMGLLWAFCTSHQKLWVNIYEERLVMGGRTNRNPWGFKTRFQKLTEEIQALSS